MSTLKVNAIRGTGASSDAISVNSTDGTCTAKITNNLSNRNLIINGAMQVAQRGTSSTDNGYGTVDRFRISYSGTDEAPTQAQHALTSSDTGPWEKGFRYSYHITNGNQTSGAGATDYIFPRENIEAQNIANSGWNYTSASSYITLSFWVKSSVAQNFYGTLHSQDGAMQNYVWETGSLSADTWTKITKKIPGNSNLSFNNDTGNGLEVYPVRCFDGTDRTASMSLDTWGAYSSSSRTPDCTSTWYTTNDATLEITGVQLEVSDHATEFEHRSYGDELVRCQRYYYLHASGDNDPVCSSTNYNTVSAYGVVSFPVTMRAEPSLEYTDATDYYQCFGNGGSDKFSTIAFQVKSENGAALGFDGNLSVSAGDGSWIETCNASAKIAFSSEL